MYSYIFFGLMMVGIFSIIENLRNGHGFSNIRMYIILFLSFITISSFLDFLSEFGYDFKLLKSIIGLSALISFINLFYFIANRKIPKAVKFDVYENTKVVSHGLDVQFEAGIKEAKAPKIVS